MKKNSVLMNLAKGLDRLKAQLSGQRRLDSDAVADESRSGSDERLGTEPEDYLDHRSDLSVDDAPGQELTLSSEQLEALPMTTEFHSVDLGKRAQLEVYQTLWLEDLIYRLLPEEGEPSSDESAEAEDVSDEFAENAYESTRKLMSLLYATFSNLADEFNKLATGFPQLAQLRVSVSEVGEVREVLADSGSIEQTTVVNRSPVDLFRSRVSNTGWVLSIRGLPGKIEFFLVPAPEMFLLSRGETAARLKTVLCLNKNIDADVWTVDGLTADPDELFYVSRALFKNLVLGTSLSDDDEDSLRARILDNLEGEELRDAVKQILLTEQNMAQKIVSQQEEIQNRIARDLHDAVIADIMSLKRGIAAEKRLSNEVLALSLDQICQRLREICHDLAPRDLKDWGLQTVIDDLVERLAQRTGVDCSFIFEGEMPDLPYQVQLHIYRIVQESLNNIEKYAQASRIIVQLEADPHKVKLTLRDNGKGFVNPENDTRSKREGGTGLSGIKERTEMIRCFFPARLLVVSKPGKGSVTTLEVRV